MKRLQSMQQVVTGEYGGNAPLTFVGGALFPANIYSPQQGRVKLSSLGHFQTMQTSQAQANVPAPVNGRGFHPAPYQSFGPNQVCQLSEEDLLDVVSYIFSKEDCFVSRCAYTGAKKPRYKAPMGCEHMWASLEAEIGMPAHYLIELYIANQDLIEVAMQEQDSYRMSCRPSEPAKRPSLPVPQQVTAPVKKEEEEKGGMKKLLFYAGGAALLWWMFKGD